MISSVFEWLNKFSGAVNTLLTLVLVVVTAIYVYLTGRLVRENIALRENASRPVLSITTSLHEAHIHIIDLLIENIGGGAAHHIRLRPSTPFSISKRERIDDIGPFRKGITYLGPHQKLELFLASAIEKFDQLKQQPLQIEAEYADEGGKIYHKTFAIDFEELEGISRVGAAPLFTIAESIKKLQESFTNLSSAGKLPVLAYSLEDMERERTANKLWYKFSRLSAADRGEIERLMDLKLDNPGANENDQSCT